MLLPLAPPALRNPRVETEARSLLPPRATTPDDGEDSGDERIALLSNMADAPGAGVGSGTKTAVAADVALAEAIQNEHNLTFWEAVKLYPAAVGWSVFVSIGVIMLAFDPQLLGNLYATPQFQRDFGYEFNGEVQPFFYKCGYTPKSAWSTNTAKIVHY